MGDYLLGKYGIALTLDELCAELKLNKRTVYNQMSRGEFPIPWFKVGKALRFRATEVANFCG